MTKYSRRSPSEPQKRNVFILFYFILFYFYFTVVLCGATESHLWQHYAMVRCIVLHTTVYFGISHEHSAETIVTAPYGYRVNASLHYQYVTTACDKPNTTIPVHYAVTFSVHLMRLRRRQKRCTSTHLPPNPVVLHSTVWLCGKFGTVRFYAPHCTNDNAFRTIRQSVRAGMLNR